MLEAGARKTEKIRAEARRCEDLGSHPALDFRFYCFLMRLKREPEKRSQGEGTAKR